MVLAYRGQWDVEPGGGDPDPSRARQGLALRRNHHMVDWAKGATCGVGSLDKEEALLD